MFLWKAIRAGEIEQALRQIAEGADCYTESDCGETPLELASARGYLPVVKALLAVGVPPNHGASFSPLDAAVMAGQLEVIRILLDAGADANERDKDGSSPLASAAYAGGLSMVRLLVGAGADVNAEDSYRQSALWHALERGNRDVYEYLVPLSSPRTRRRAFERLANAERQGQRPFSPYDVYPDPEARRWSRERLAEARERGWFREYEARQEPPVDDSGPIDSDDYPF